MNHNRNMRRALAIMTGCTYMALVSAEEIPHPNLALELYTMLSSQTTPDQYHKTWLELVEHHTLDVTQQQAVISSALTYATTVQAQLTSALTQLEAQYGASPTDKRPYAYAALAGAGYLTIGVAVFVARLAHTIKAIGYTVEEEARPDLLGLFAFPLQSMCQYILIKKSQVSPTTIQWIEQMSTMAQVVCSLGLIPYGIYWATKIIQASKLHTDLKVTLTHAELIVQFLTTVHLSYGVEIIP